MDFFHTSLVVVRNVNSLVASKNFADLTNGLGINRYRSNSHKCFQRSKLRSDHNIKLEVKRNEAERCGKHSCALEQGDGRGGRGAVVILNTTIKFEVL
jgi:hypothetical protein